MNKFIIHLVAQQKDILRFHQSFEKCIKQVTCTKILNMNSRDLIIEFKKKKHEDSTIEKMYNDR